LDQFVGQFGRSRLKTVSEDVEGAGGGVKTVNRVDCGLGEIFLADVEVVLAGAGRKLNIVFPEIFLNFLY